MPDARTLPDFRTRQTPPLSVNTRLFDRFVRRAHQIERVKRGLARDTSRFLRDSVFSGLGETLTTALNRIRGRRDVAAIHGTKAFRNLVKTTTGTLNAGYGRAMDDLAKQLRFLALEESRFVVSVLGQDIPFDYSAKVPALRDFRKAIRNQPFQGRTLQQWFKGMATNTATQTVSQVNLGLLGGETTGQIVRRMTAKGKGVFDKALLEAEQIAETAAGHAGNNGAGLAIEANVEVIAWEVWTAILDSATCVICGGLDGNKYRVGEGPIPIDSTHPVCRCNRIPQLKSAKELGLKEGDLTPIERRAMDGRVSEKTTYRQWFKRQSAKFQDNVLGKTKGRLYRQGKVTINQMVDADLKPLSLDELRKGRRLTAADIRIPGRGKPGILAAGPPPPGKFVKPGAPGAVTSKGPAIKKAAAPKKAGPVFINPSKVREVRKLGNPKEGGVDVAAIRERLRSLDKSAIEYKDRPEMLANIKKWREPLEKNLKRVTDGLRKAGAPEAIKGLKKEYGDLLTVVNPDSPETMLNALDLASVPPRVRARLRAKFVHTEISDLHVPDMFGGAYRDLKGAAARGQAGLWDNVPAMYDSATKSVGAGARSFVRRASNVHHETGHAVHHLLTDPKLSKQWVTIWKKEQKLGSVMWGSPYYSSTKMAINPGVTIGAQESFADVFAWTISQNQSVVRQMYGSETADWMFKFVRSLDV